MGRRLPSALFAVIATLATGSLPAGANPEPKLVPAATPPAAAKPAPVRRRLHFVAGEQFTWRLSVRGLTAGHVQLAVGEPGTVKGKKVVMLAAAAAPEGLFRLVGDASGITTVTVNVNAGVPIMHRLETKGGWVESRLGGPEFDVVVKRSGKEPDPRHQTMPPGELAYDTPAALLALRPLRSGQQLAMSVLADDMIWRVALKAAAREKIKTPVGGFPTVRLDGEAQRLDRKHAVNPGRSMQPFKVWVTDDAYRLPVRVTATMPYGEVRLELVTYEGGDLALGTE